MAPPEMDLQDKKGILSQRDGNEIVPKIKKPYTISKQRDRWTEEEHNKFLEALQLYGRAWRRIEEHIGTKTTVQIRSHAQKFFSKVTKEPINNGANIEIPPPRPKRKPSHPYPRKLGNQTKLDTKMLNTKSGNSFSQTSQEKGTLLPTSVLSSENLENLDSNSNGSNLLLNLKKVGTNHQLPRQLKRMCVMMLKYPWKKSKHLLLSFSVKQ